jgi:hypothetical protein
VTVLFVGKQPLNAIADEIKIINFTTKKLDPLLVPIILPTRGISFKISIDFIISNN